MSSVTTAKEIAPVVDSSVTQKLNVGHLHDTENSSCMANGGSQPPTAEQQGHCKNLLDDTYTVVKPAINTRYFIIKSLNHQNIQLSVQKGIWATQVMNEPILEEAFHNSDKVILIFSVNMSGFFQGYAQMMSSVGWRRDKVWSQGAGGSNPWGRSFKVKWLRLNNLPFHKTLHLKNPLNDYKPVKISRDCQELSPDIGELLCDLIDKEINDGEKGVRDNGHLRWHPMDSPCSFQDELYNDVHNNVNLGRGSMFYPQQHISEANRSHLAYQGSVGVYYPGESPFMTSEPAHYTYSFPNRKIAGSRDCEAPSQLDGWGLPDSVDPLYNNISEDEFLEMSYEEYLEAYGAINKRRSDPAVASSRGKQESSNKEDDEDLSSPSGHKRSRKRSRH